MTPSYQLGLCITEFMSRFSDARSSATQFREVLVELHRKGNLKQLERAVRELIEWIEDLEPPDRAAFITHAANQGIVYSSTDYLRRVDEMLTQKRLRSREDYDILREFVERNHSDPMDQERVSHATRLIDAFEANRS